MRNAIFLMSMAALAACSQGAPGGAPGTEKAVFQDVPVPPALTYDKGYGHATSSGHIRVYTQELSGPGRREEIVRFYREKLPMHGWTLATEETFKLTFGKKEEQCVVEVFNTTTGVQVTVKLNYRP